MVIATWQVSTASGGTGGVTIDPYEDVGSVNAITWDVSGTSTNYEAILTGNTTLNLTNVRNGDYGTLIVTQDGVGSHTLTFGAESTQSCKWWRWNTNTNIYCGCYGHTFIHI